MDILKLKGINEEIMDIASKRAQSNWEAGSQHSLAF